MKPEEFDGRAMYTVYICNLAANGNCCYNFLDKAKEPIAKPTGYAIGYDKITARLSWQ
jgi:hypothetical protein